MVLSELASCLITQLGVDAVVAPRTYTHASVSDTR